MLAGATPWLKSFDDLPGDRLIELIEQIVKITHADDCSISKWNHADNTVEIVASITYATWERHQGPSYDAEEWPITANALKDGQWTVMRRDDPDITPNELDDLNVFNAQMAVVMPISIKGRALGIVELIKLVDDGPVPEETLRLWKNATDQAAIAFENALLFDQTQRSLTVQITLRDASNVIVSALEARTVLSQLAERVCSVAGATSVYICDFDENKTSTTVIAEYMDFAVVPEEYETDIDQKYPVRNRYAVFMSMLEKGQ